MSTNYVFFVAVFLLFNIATRCAVGELIRRELDWPSCGETSWARETHITSFRESPVVCKYHLKAYSPRVRQLFIEFSTVMAPPVYENGALECVHDYFEIAGQRLCGFQQNQRLSVPFKATEGVEEITLTGRLAPRCTICKHIEPEEPYWIIRIQQVEEESEASSTTQLTKLVGITPTPK